MIIKFLSESFIIVLFCLFTSKANSQSYVDAELKSLFKQEVNVHQDFSKPLKESQNEFDITFSSLFLFYKTFISSQDMPTCIFTPSCSEYAVEAFRKKGLLTGWISTFDRLSRCHGFVNHNDYPLDSTKLHFYDPIL
jgi:hypothetical protein